VIDVSEPTPRVAIRLSLPEPCLVVLVGAAGSGKSTLAARHFAPDEILSSDAYRGLVAGDPGDQSATQAAFRRLHAELHRRLAEGRTTLVDATNVTAFARRSLTRIAARHARPVVAIVLDLPPDLVLARNAMREGRIVPEAAVRTQLADLAKSIRRGALDAEGFAKVHHLRLPEEVDGLEVVRLTRAS
jgi:predicted kinase